jgi:hypothetical protein
LILHVLEVEGSSFCKLTVKETVDGGWAAVAQFSRCLAMVRVGGGDDRWSSSKQQLGAGGLGLVGRRCELKQQMAARVRGFQLDLGVGFI